jgi:predicted nucleotidyltransferase
MHPLIEKNRQDILTLAQDNGVTKVRIFGSMARRDVSLTSDVDFLDEIEEGRSGLALGGFLMDVSDLLHRKVDVVTEKSLHPNIQSQVLKEAIAL